MKAFDTVRWDFLLTIMHARGFPSKFISWIAECISTSRFSVSINGELVGFFGSTRGLRQGDPISASLFVLVMDALSTLIDNRVTSNSNFKYHWICEKTKTTHLCFADDLILFGGDSVHSADLLRRALLDFSTASGLSPNIDKSSIFIAGSNPLYKEAVVSLFGYLLGSLPVRYLGIPLLSSKLTAADCMELVDRITARIRSWTTKFLSYAGRLQLIQSVLFGIHSFWASLLLLPKSIILRIERIIRAYLWRGNDDRGGGAKVAWDDVTCPKQEGGLGLRSLEEWNKALMAKHLWKLCHPSPTSSWAKWAKANLLRGRSLWEIDVPQNSSWNWRKILKLRDVFR